MALSGKCTTKHVSTESKDPFRLAKWQLKFYWDNGFIIVRNLFDIPKLNLFRDRFMEICNNKTDASKFCSVVKDPSLYREDLPPEMFINKIQDLLFDPVFKRYSEDPRMLDIISQLVGDDITAVSCMLINKPPGTGEHPTHQDLHVFPFRPADKIVGAWTAVDPVTRINGCLYIIPTSHTKGTLYDHCEVASDKKLFYHGIKDETRVAPADRRVYLEMRPGDTVFFHPLLVHGSGCNGSQDFRKAISAHYASSSCRYIEVKGTNQEFLASLVEEELKRRGGHLKFVDVWRIKSKQVKGSRCHL